MRFIFFLVLFCGSGYRSFAHTEPYQTIMNRIHLDLQNSISDKVLTNTVNKGLLNLEQDGSWTDINYADVQYEPLSRIKAMAMCFIRPSNQLYNDPEIFNSIVKALQNWLDRN